MFKLGKIMNYGEENYISLIDIKDKNSTEPLLELSNIFYELGEILDLQFNGAVYKDNIGEHCFIENEEIKIHIIIGEDKIHLIYKCSEEKRKEILEKLSKK